MYVCVCVGLTCLPQYKVSQDAGVKVSHMDSALLLLLLLLLLVVVVVMAACQEQRR
jgi:hypothetical protein